MEETDHAPLQVKFAWAETLHRKKNKNCPVFDCFKTKQPDAVVAFREAIAKIPPIPWETDMNAHLRMVQDQVLSAAAEAFPKDARTTQPPYVSNRSLLFLRVRRGIKRGLMKASGVSQSPQKIDALRRLAVRLWKGDLSVATPGHIESQEWVSQVADIMGLPPDYTSAGLHGGSCLE
eukprot:3495681-Pyramimonas_sp.AAC.1